jgi:hypothetical protein
VTAGPPSSCLRRPPHCLAYSRWHAIAKVNGIASYATSIGRNRAIGGHFRLRTIITYEEAKPAKAARGEAKVTVRAARFTQQRDLPRPRVGPSPPGLGATSNNSAHLARCHSCSFARCGRHRPMPPARGRVAAAVRESAARVAEVPDVSPAAAPLVARRDACVLHLFRTRPIGYNIRRLGDGAATRLVPGFHMTRRDWWIGVGVIALALMAHAVIPQYVPRYEWRHESANRWLRVDRWTGTAEPVRVMQADRYPEPPNTRGRR